MSASIIGIIILSYFLLLLVISAITSRKADNFSFFLGNKKSPWFVIAFGMIGASLSGVTFISVPGWVGDSQFSYMPMVFGYLLGYIFIANILLPLYYRLNLTSIYTYLLNRFGKYSYKTGASFFLISRIIGASFRLFLVANVLQFTIFDNLTFMGKTGVPFWITVSITILLIWLYTFKGGIKTIIWTDTFQTLFMLLAVGISIIMLSKELNLNFENLITTIKNSHYSKMFFFDDWNNKGHFLKQFISGAFITIVMTGLDQDMMQKNLSCKNIHEAKKNMYWFSVILIPVNLVFLSLGALLFIFCQTRGVMIPKDTDLLFPMIATGGYLQNGNILGVFFIIGLIAAAYSSADSALTALTTSFTVDILNISNKDEKSARHSRIITHIFISLLLAFVILIFKLINNQNVISSLFTAAGYTYGPLLGLYTFGLFTNLSIKDKWVPVVGTLSPALTFLLQTGIESYWFKDFKLGFLVLVLNGFISFLGFISIANGKHKTSPVQ
jgi:SSS family solute:Na+ symporter